MSHSLAASQHDRTLPYTYEAWYDILGGQGREPVWHHYFSDTLCGLIETLAGEGIGPDRAMLYGVYRTEQILLDNEVLSDPGGRWLERPELCRSLETHYERTLEQRYRGHVDQGHCSFEDRDREGLGPF